MSTHNTKKSESTSTTVTWNELPVVPTMTDNAATASAVGTPRNIVLVSGGVRSIQDELNTYVINPSG
jgi:hypothetical protein